MLWLSNPHQPPSFGMQWLSSTLPCCCPLPSLQSAPRTPHHHDARSCDILTFDKSRTVHEVLIASVSRSSTTLQTPLCTFAATWNIASSVCKINYHPIRFAIGVRKAMILLDLVSPCQQRSSATRADVCRARHAFWWTTVVNVLHLKPVTHTEEQKWWAMGGLQSAAASAQLYSHVAVNRNCDVFAMARL